MSRGVRFVIADDSESFREILRNLIGLIPVWTVLGEAKDGVEAVEQIARYHPDIVLLDIVMPRMDGVQATRYIRQTFPNVKIIAFTAHHDEEFCLQSLKAGAHCFMWKDDLNAHNLERCVQISLEPRAPNSRDEITPPVPCSMANKAE